MAKLAHWAVFRPLLADLKKAETMVFAPAKEPVLTVQPEPPDRAAALHTLERQVGEMRYLLLVNDEETEMGVCVGLDKARGALVSEVVAGGPAAQAGLRAGDIILQFDGKAVNRHQDLPFTAARLPSGKTVLVRVWRGRAAHVLSLRVERKPE